MTRKYPCEQPETSALFLAPFYNYPYTIGAFFTFAIYNV